MRNKILCLIISYCFYLPVQLQAASFTDQIAKLVDKNYDFFSFNKTKIHYLTGKNRFKKISFHELKNPKQFSHTKIKIDPSGIAKDILYFKKEKYKILIRKNKKFYLLKGSKFTPFKLPSTEKEFFQ